MGKINKICIDDTISLLEMFNNREKVAFGVVYTKYCRDFIHFANKIFRDTSYDSEDALQDIFISIWNNKKRTFDSFENLKVYIYVALKNKFKELCNHSKCVEKYNEIFISERSFTTQVAESEVISVMASIATMLPDECAKVFALHIEGYDVKEIADKLQKSESTIYKQKREAISILKHKLPKNRLIILFPYLF